MLAIEPQQTSDTKITVTSTATNLFDLMNTSSSVNNSRNYYNQGFCSALILQAEDGDVRWLERGTPTATQGQLVKKGQKEWITNSQLDEIKLISTSGNVAVTAIPYRGESKDNPALMSGEVSATGTLVPEEHDFIDCDYTDCNLTKVTYKLGGSGGTTVATLDITYDADDNIDTITKT